MKIGDRVIYTHNPNQYRPAISGDRGTIVNCPQCDCVPPAASMELCDLCFCCGDGTNSDDCVFVVWDNPLYGTDVTDGAGMDNLRLLTAPELIAEVL
jgi:hypothetical protein